MASSSILSCLMMSYSTWLFIYAISTSPPGSNCFLSRCRVRSFPSDTLDCCIMIALSDFEDCIWSYEAMMNIWSRIVL